ncbi:PREDICTED: uncharacterized protein LOC102007563 [Chinchilla lanigera]|uniref:uncharacterized protein LOC102007563 n=1 Tax=Chinchilla lanigera TaxID=34839 RepID=UPI000696A4C6|nr:PREDICTED: uncharacterized protein LOC102007563 [Chinchilla lanigera]
MTARGRPERLPRAGSTVAAGSSRAALPDPNNRTGQGATETRRSPHGRASRPSLSPPSRGPNRSAVRTVPQVLCRRGPPPPPHPTEEKQEEEEEEVEGRDRGVGVVRAALPRFLPGSGAHRRKPQRALAPAPHPRAAPGPGLRSTPSPAARALLRDPRGASPVVRVLPTSAPSRQVLPERISAGGRENRRDRRGKGLPGFSVRLAQLDLTLAGVAERQNDGRARASRILLRVWVGLQKRGAWRGEGTQARQSRAQIILERRRSRVNPAGTDDANCLQDGAASLTDIRARSYTWRVEYGGIVFQSHFKGTFRDTCTGFCKPLVQATRRRPSWGKPGPRHCSLPRLRLARAASVPDPAARGTPHRLQPGTLACISAYRVKSLKPLTGVDNEASVKFILENKRHRRKR